ncbi:hypothetical protein GOBAR_DD16241 [Gossypium barbadense]|nr:hypothetical protein GOBAR_DD16241 [Gossypium barbadense]
MASLNTPILVDDGFNEYESALKRQKSTTSNVWDEMTKLECENKNELKAQSNHSVNKFDADECHQAIFTFLMCDKHSFRTVEEPGFRYMMRIASPNFKNISRHTAARDVLMYYAKERDRVKEELAKAPVRAGLELANDVVDVLDYWGQRDKDYQIFALSNEEWRNVAILCKFLKVFYDVTCVFFGSDYPTANLYFSGVWKVHKVLLDTVKGPYSFLTPMIKQMQEKFNKYWAEYSLILSCAAILHPRYKLNYVQYCFTTIYGVHASDFVETILSNLRLLFDEYVKKFKSTSSSLAGSSNVSDKNPIDSNLDEHNVNSADFGGDFDGSDDYKCKSSVRYNELSLLACDLLAIPISTVASESAFSMEIDCKNDDDNEGDEDDEDDVSSIAF